MELRTKRWLSALTLAGFVAVLTVLIVVVVHPMALADECRFRTQPWTAQEVRQYGCDVIFSDLIISGSGTPVEIPRLLVAHGTIEVRDARTLKIPRLLEVGGSLVVTGSRTLETLECPDLTTVSGALTVTYNLALTRVDLHKLQEVRQSATVWMNFMLSDLDLSALESVDRDLTLDVPNVNLDDLARVGGSLALHHTNTTKLGSLLYVYESLTLSGTEGPVHLPTLAHVENVLTWFPRNFSDLDCPMLAQVGSLVLDKVHAARLPSLSTVMGNLLLSDLPKDATLELPALKSVWGHLRLDNSDISSPVVLPKLHSVLGSVTLFRLPALQRVDFPVLMSVGGSLETIFGAPELSWTLPKLRVVEQDVLVAFMTEPFLALPTLETIGGLRVLQVSGLVRLFPLPVLSKVDGDLTLDQNRDLADISSLESLKVLHGALRVRHNNISLSKFQRLQGLKLNASEVMEPAWPCAMVEETGLKTDSANIVCKL